MRVTGRPLSLLTNVSLPHRFLVYGMPCGLFTLFGKVVIRLDTGAGLSVQDPALPATRCGNMSKSLLNHTVPQFGHL